MSQDFVSNQDSLVAGGGNSFSLTATYATGTVVPLTGTYVTKNKYMDLFRVYGKDEIFGTDATGKKCSWSNLNPATTTANDGGFNSVKVSPGTI